MNRITVPFINRDAWLIERHKNINSTEGACLLDAHKYKTKAELWYDKRNPEHTDITPNMAMKVGTALQDSIAHLAAGEKGWEIKPKTEYIYIEGVRAGSSFDFEIIGADTLIEVKNMGESVFKRDCLVNGDIIELPLHYEIQAQWEMWVSGYRNLWFTLLVGGRELYFQHRIADDKLQAIFESKTKEFWDTIDSNQPPAFNFELDKNLISRLYGYAEPGKIMNADDTIRTLAWDYHELSNQLRELQDKKDAKKAEILVAIGDSEKVLCDEFSISAGMVAPAHVEFDRAGYRNFRFYQRKTK